ncbi:NADH-quinone oxidoreductase subunit NuoF [Natroniella acetigena]|uniref:NADH-quinone oxidoreductase subunit NuoF n=1 Tax=Natroniella acetigena TaxID=52004 RepID=UPI00200B9085|nr:NADH-quinone oxidoreductase subunit NuoF [Natroniella acetigena]MCK8828447.1 NADH-quinone oxidoreductase subunit NuoF [Natroniella acetigena]
MQNKYEILLCAGTSCNSSGEPTIYQNLITELKEHDLFSETKITQTGCFGFCELGPIITIHAQGEEDEVFYCQVKAEDVERIVREHLVNGGVIEDLLYIDPETEKKVAKKEDMDFYKYQKRIVLDNCGKIDPLEIEEYMEQGGYQALKKAVTELEPKQVIAEVKESGLRGRGGGGFPTGIKWEITYENQATPKYIICNADEGDPGAFMDRSILEGDPHSVLEGLALGAYAIGATQGFVYVRAEYPLAVERLERAIKSAREEGMLGDNIHGSQFSFDVEIRIGAGAFVCGEETALITSVEGYRGDPQSKPPYPAQDGLWGQPTLINNVETLANVPIIIREGGAWYRKLGTEDSTGTKVFALAGDINNTGLIEVPIGISLSDVIFKLGGGIPDEKEFKAVQTGGPSGGCLPADYLDTPLEYDALLEVGSMMGSGGLIILDETSCMVDVARFYLDFTQDEACGKCAPGRIGTKRLLEIMDQIVEGEGRREDLERLKNLSQTIKRTALCGLCKSAPNPVLSAIEHFEDEYLAHAEDKYCPTGVCKGLQKYKIDSELCKVCGKCEAACPAQAIKGEVGDTYEIDREVCTACGICEEECPFEVISKD